MQSCQYRKGSLDATIRDARANDIHAFCSAHPSIRRIVCCNGQGQVKIFGQHFPEWMASRQLVLSGQEETTQETTIADRAAAPHGWTAPHTIELVPALSVSPAAAMYSYEEKRDFWDSCEFLVRRSWESLFFCLPRCLVFIIHRTAKQWLSWWPLSAVSRRTVAAAITGRVRMH